MSRTEKRTEVDEWEVEVCDACGHDEGQHYKAPKRVDLSSGGWYVAVGCMTLKRDGRLLEGSPEPNPYARCECTEFK